MISRRGLIGVMLGGAVAGPALGAETGKPHRIGYLRHGPAALDPNRDAFIQGLRDFGYIAGRNIVVEDRYSDGRDDLLETYAKELASLPADVIVTSGTPAVVAAARATRSVPIVVGAIGDPIASGVIASLARPGGNVTGTSIISADLARKRIEVLHEAMPHLTRVGVLWNPGNSSNPRQVAEALAGAQIMGVSATSYPAKPPEELATAFAAMRRDGIGGVLILDDGELLFHGAAFLRLANAEQMPVVAGLRPFSDIGALITYGPDTNAGFRRAGYFVDRILKGAKPGDLPFEQISKIELVVNLKIAKALGISIPPAILVRADEVIE